MSVNAIKLMTLLKENLLEIGDLKNIVPYKINKTRKGRYKFEAEGGDVVDVIFTRVSEHVEYIISTAPIVNKDEISSYYNLGYSIKGISTQAKKSNVRELLKIMSTLLLVVRNFIEEHPNSAIMIFEENKEEQLGLTLGQKSLLYKSVISQNLPSGYLSSPVKFIHKNKGIIIAPK